MSFFCSACTRSFSAVELNTSALLKATCLTLFVLSNVWLITAFAAEPRVRTISSDTIDSYAALDDLVVFDQGEELWVSDGTVVGTQSIYDFGFLRSSSDYIRLNDSVVFRVSSDLWVTDGTTQGTQLLSSNMPGITVRGGVRLGSFVYYLIDATSTDVALWRTDGTSVGTEQIAIIANASPRLENGFALSQLVAFGTNLAFVLDSDAHGEEVWVSEGSQATTQVLKDIIPVFSNRAGGGR